MKTFVVLHELCKIWSLARFHSDLLCNREQDLIESYLLVNFPQSRSALLLVLSEQMNQYFCSSTMKKTVFVTHINQSIPGFTVTSCQCVVGHGWNVVKCCDPAFDRVVSSPLAYHITRGSCFHNALYGRGGSYRNLFWVQVYKIRERISF